MTIITARCGHTRSATVVDGNGDEHIPACWLPGCGDPEYIIPADAKEDQLIEQAARVLDPEAFDIGVVWPSGFRRQAARDVARRLFDAGLLNAKETSR